MPLGRNISVDRGAAARPSRADERSGPGLRAMAALAAVLCNAAILAGLCLDLGGTAPIVRSADEVKTFALPVTAATEPPPPPPVRRKTAPASPVPHPLPTTPAPAASAAPVPAPRSAMPPLPGPSAAPSPPSPTPTKREDAQAGSAWNDYQARVWARIAARKPRGINLPGEVLLAFTLDSGGRLITARIVRPSGNPQLDRLALRTLNNAAPFAPPPAAVGDRPLTFTIRFGFR